MNHAGGEIAQHLLCGAREGCMEKRTTDMDLKRELGGRGAGGVEKQNSETKGK